MIYKLKPRVGLAVFLVLMALLPSGPSKAQWVSGGEPYPIIGWGQATGGADKVAFFGGHTDATHHLVSIQLKHWPHSSSPGHTTDTPHVIWTISSPSNGIIYTYNDPDGYSGFGAFQMACTYDCRSGGTGDYTYTVFVTYADQNNNQGTYEAVATGNPTYTATYFSSFWYWLQNP